MPNHAVSVQNKANFRIPSSSLCRRLIERNDERGGSDRVTRSRSPVGLLHIGGSQNKPNSCGQTSIRRPGWRCDTIANGIRLAERDGAGAAPVQLTDHQAR